MRRLLRHGFALIGLAVVSCKAGDLSEQQPWHALASDGHLALLRHAPGTGDPADFDLNDCVTHQVNITALTEVFPSSGEIVVARKNASGTLSVLGTIETDVP